MYLTNNQIINQSKQLQRKFLLFVCVFFRSHSDSEKKKKNKTVSNMNFS